MESVATSGLKALVDTGGPGWIVAALAVIGMVFLYRELQKCQAQLQVFLRESYSATASAAQAAQAMTIALEAVKRGVEDIARLSVENSRAVESLGSKFESSQVELRGHRAELLRVLDAIQGAPRPRRAP